MGALLSEEVAVLGVIDPDAYTTGSYTSDWCDMTQFKRVMAVIMAGTLGTTAGITGYVYQASDSSGTGAKAITGKSTTELTAVGTDSDKQAIINVREDELDVANDFTHVAAIIVVATATSDGGAIVLGGHPQNGPASDNDLSSVDEIV